MKIIFTILFFNLLVFSAVASDFNQKEILQYQVISNKLNKARSDLSPKTGSSSTSFNQQEINNLPQGQASSLSSLLLRAKGVTQDSYSQLHIRGDHSNVQYRINNVIIPEGINAFGSTLDVRFAKSIDLHTGVLPAQYGYRTAGVVEIKTKDQINKQNNNPFGGYSEVQIGSNDNIGFNQQFSGNNNKLNYFVSGSYLQNNRGIEAPTSARKSINNDTKQDKFFLYASYLLSDTKQFSAIIANSNNRFQIPTSANLEPSFNMQGQVANSAQIRQNQQEDNKFIVLSLQEAINSNFDYQISLFNRQSGLKFRGDKTQDIMFSGVASDIDRNSLASGLQGDSSLKINDKNTLRVGVYFNQTKIANNEKSWVLSTDNNGDQTSDIATIIANKNSKITNLYSIYTQNEYAINQDLKLNFGGRFDKVQGVAEDQQFSPRFGSVYQLNNKTKLHAGYAKYFTAPKAELVTDFNINSFQNTSNASENLQNNKIRSEKTDYYDVGLVYNINQDLNFGFDAYYKDIKNMLDEGQFGNALIFKPFNYAKAKSYGVELAVNHKTKTWQNYVNLAWQQSHAYNLNSSQYLHETAEINYTKQGVRPDHDQRITASAGSVYNFVSTKLMIGGDVLFGSGLRRGEANTQKMPSYTQFNLFISKKIDQWQLRLALNNVLNRSYSIRDGSGIGISAAQFANKRTANLFASYEF
jgi:outer membrane receptor protein involved in Fe transport